MIGLDGLQAAQPDPQDDPHVIGIALVDGKVGILEQHLRPGHGKLGETIHAARLLGRDERLGIEALHFTRYARIVGRTVKMGNGTQAGFARDEAFPGGLDIIGQRGQAGQTSNDDAGAAHVCSFLQG